MSNKLYGLYIVETEDSIMRLTAASNEIQKLKDVVFTPDHAFIVCGSLERERDKLMTHTAKGNYPYYLIYELPYIV